MWAVQNRKSLATMVFTSQQGGEENRSQLEAPSSVPNVFLTLGNPWGSGASSKTPQSTLL